MKTLIFEGAGWADADTSKATDVSNCRIRTRLRNNVGRVIYLEMGSTIHTGKFIPEFAKNLHATTWITFCFYTDAKWDKKRCSSKTLNCLKNEHFEYNKTNIINFVNKNLDCSFDDMIVLNEGLFVFDTEEPICDSSNGDYKPYKDVEININELDSVKPKYKETRINLADYKVSYNSLIQMPYMQDYLNNKTERELYNIKFDGGCVRFRWDNSGIITDLEVDAGVCISMGTEDIKQIIDLIKQDNVQIAV